MIFISKLLRKTNSKKSTSNPVLLKLKWQQVTLKMSISTVGYAAQNCSGILTPWKFELRNVGPKDVHIRVVACGVCQTDVHFGKNDWKKTIYPFVPGHEITGYVEAVGEEVSKVKIGDKAAVGFIIGCCQSCENCNQNLEQYCAKRAFNSIGPLKDGSRCYGGYARDIVCEEKFVCRYPESLDLYTGSALLCAGITVYSSMKRFGMDKPGKRLGVIGLGGLGHLAVKFGVSFGLQVTVLSRSESKRDEATTLLGAQQFLNTTDDLTFKNAIATLDFLIDTVGAPKDIDAYLSLLRVDGVMVMLAIPEKPLQFNGMSLVDSRRILTGSVVGSIEETEDMLQFCADNNVLPEIEKVPIDYVNTAWERLLSSDVRYRFVLDIENSCPKI